MRRKPAHLPAEVAAALGRFFRSSGTSRLGPTHGDFAPWNLLKAKDDWVLLDWESATPEGEPFWDVFHFIVQGAALLGKPSTEQIFRGLGGKGWVGAALQAYATAAGLQMNDAPKAFRVYLTHTLPRLDPATTDGRRGFITRTEFLARLDQQ
ncbi:MAG: phosphotransferase [Actinobacteria bacterium]|nr:phosphotransferase [Actinomycetota bacterium]